MTDGIQKGAGTAYKLQAPANAASLYPTYDRFIQAFSSGQFLTDLKINPEGWDVLGTSLGKANLLQDATAALYGKNAAATPDEILVAIRSLITSVQTTADQKTRRAGGTYYGDGQSYKTLTFPFSPSILFLQGGTTFAFAVVGTTGVILGSDGAWSLRTTRVTNGVKFTADFSGNPQFMNQSNATYRYTAFS